MDASSRGGSVDHHRCGGDQRSLPPLREFSPRYVAATAGKATTDALNEKYVRGEIRIVTEQARYPLATIVTMLESGDYDLNPEFQRRHRWDRVKQSRLIESFIMNPSAA